MKSTRFTKFLSVLLSVLIICSVVFSTNAFAVVSASDFEITETTWSPPYSESCTFKEITGFNENANPEEISTLDLTVLSEDYDGREYIIGKEAFKDNTYIENVKLASADYTKGAIYGVPLVKISEGAFENCTSLKSVESLSSLKCNMLMYVTESLEEIGSRAFKGCTSLDDFVVPSRVEKIDSEAFADCTSLKRVVIYGGVSSIADDAFKGCESLTIYGMKNSYAHEYAIRYDIPFVQIGEGYYTQGDIDLLYEIDYMSFILMEVYRGSSYNNIYPTYYIYSFKDKWGAELKEAREEAIAKFENPFLSQVEIEEAIANARNAIYRAEIIEEIYRLGNPRAIMGGDSDPWHCTACERAATMISDSFSTMYPHYNSLTEQSYNMYLACRDYAYSLVESGNATTVSLEDSLQSLKWSAEELVFQVEEDLGLYVRFLPEHDFSIYTDDTAESLKSAIADGKYIVDNFYRGTNYSYYIIKK